MARCSKCRAIAGYLSFDGCTRRTFIISAGPSCILQLRATWQEPQPAQCQAQLGRVSICPGHVATRVAPPLLWRKLSRHVRTGDQKRGDATAANEHVILCTHIMMLCEAVAWQTMRWLARAATSMQLTGAHCA
jgi:hypothetical protein